MKIIEFNMENSSVNKSKVLVATAEDGSKWVLGGSPDFPQYIIPYDKAWDIVADKDGYMPGMNPKNKF